MFVVYSFAETRTLKQRIYKLEDLNLFPNTSYVVQNISPNEYVSIIISDSNQIIYEGIQLEPLSKKYYLQPLRFSFLMSIIGKGEVVIS